MHTRSLPLLTSLLYLSSTVTTVHAAPSSKRGIVYVTPASPSDDEIWARPSNDLSWYYNYVYTPTAALASASHLSFVPMLWGAPPSPTSDDTSFLDSITSQLSSGANITHILAYNEPDGSSATGGSNLSPDAAANTWLRNIKPLRDDHGVKVGLPAVTGSPGGIEWLGNFNGPCAALNADEGCAADFIPIHWYGNFEGLASHMGQVRSLYPSLPMWITEYALSHSELEETQAFYNMSAEYFDRLEYVERYSYFGAFRSSKSNVGANAAFLTQDGELTDIGSWYLGGGATGNVPEGKAGRRLEASTLSVLGVVSAVALLLVGC
ncbi:hypothetical protein EPUS_04225 [Endocarpon pusillum Z07020]|uniref:Asl1-like glycosyl hydrolase catalytic domain-containing protein n=1 Tax=Endocarpon pusillum (strain Z07020 / HMAS-L-300199) TaxID=1263415 RepID=U1HQS0_ENDPU|nr:uncharacterized protein EPUS_04225 [Endocarpon pusillum Z07020]ERF72790.1 hypothetical protein EPUS_04225 [Endocarpon pusillum Z07020]